MYTVGEIAEGRYRIERTLGTGATSEVFLATDCENDQVVALKVLALDSPKAVSRFVREATLLRRLSHENIVRVRGVLEDPPVLIMEYVPGRTLAHLLGGEPLPLDEVIRVGLGIARGLQVIHQHGIVHRDLKPENVLVSLERVVLLDFGLVRTAGSTLTAPNQLLGTLGYLAPEAVLGDGREAAVDIFAFGAVVYEMLAGHVPVEPLVSESIADYTLRALRADIEPLECPPAPGLANLVTACLQKLPHQRPSSDQIVRELEAIQLVPRSGSVAHLIAEMRRFWPTE